jgi:hypothetical protein
VLPFLEAEPRQRLWQLQGAKTEARLFQVRARASLGEDASQHLAALVDQSRRSLVDLDHQRLQT